MRRKRGGDNVLILTIVSISILIISCLIVNKIRIPLYRSYGLPIPKKMHWLTYIIAFLLQLYFLGCVYVICFVIEVESPTIFIICSCSSVLTIPYVMWSIITCKLYASSDFTYITMIIWCLTLIFSLIPFPLEFKGEPYYHALLWVYNGTMITDIATLLIIQSIFYALHNDKDFLIRLWNGD